MVRVDHFLGITPHHARVANPENVHPYVGDSARVRALGRVVRAGAYAGAFLPPQVWRSVEAQLLKPLHANGTRRPRLSADERMAALAGLEDDIRDLEGLTGESYADWLRPVSQGDFSQRRVPPPRRAI